MFYIACKQLSEYTYLNIVNLDISKVIYLFSLGGRDRLSNSALWIEKLLQSILSLKDRLTCKELTVKRPSYVGSER